MKITRLSEITTENGLTVVNHIRQSILDNQLAEFNDAGLRFHLQHLQYVGSSIVFHPLELAAEYVDAVGKHFIDAFDCANRTHIYWPPEEEQDEFFMSINATGVGNMAYYLLYGNDLAEKKEVERLYSALGDWLLGKMEVQKTQVLSELTDITGLERDELEQKLHAGLKFMSNGYK